MYHFSDASSMADWSSMASTLRASSQSSQVSDRPDLPKTNSLQTAMSSSWASYLNAQHNSRELSNLKRNVHDQISQINASVYTLQHDLAKHQRLVETTAGEFKAVSDRVVTEVGQLKSLQDRLSDLQRVVGLNQERTSVTMGGLARRCTALQERLDGMNNLISADMKAVQAQYGSALETIEFLQGELKELRADKIQSEQKLSALEHRVEEMAGARKELQLDAVEFLGQLSLRRSELAKLLDSAEHGDARADSDTVMVSERGPPVDKSGNGNVTTAPARSPLTRKRKGPEHPPNAKRPARVQDLNALLRQHKKLYKNKTGSDVTFIWGFIDSIEDVAMSKHIQESLATIVPEHVSSTWDLRNRNGRRYIQLSEGLTWKEFQGALGKMRTMG